MKFEIHNNKFFLKIIFFFKSLFISDTSKATENKVIYMELNTGIVKIETFPEYALQIPLV